MKIKERTTTYKESMSEFRKKMEIRGSVEEVEVHGEFIYIKAVEEELDIPEAM